jgi:ABC-type lipoprotein export system ATPase subunit
VLSGADLSLREGSLTSIVGANGSGKSTVLRIAAGVTTPSGGAVRVPRRIGYVPERQAGRCGFSGAQYLTHMGLIRGLDPDGATRVGGELLTRLGVRPGPDVPWNELSQGNRQKVVLAQAFLGPLDAIVLDEPYNGLDEEARVVLTQLVREARAKGTTVLLSSHDTPADVGRTYRIVEGQLEEEMPGVPRSASGGLVRRVELAPEGAEQPHTRLTGRSDVVRWERKAEGGLLVLDVLPGGCDDLIRAALDLGWSVRSVLPIQTLWRG